MNRCFIRAASAETFARITYGLVLLVSSAALSIAADRPLPLSEPLRFTSANVRTAATDPQATPLQRLIAEGLQNNPEIRAARQEKVAAAQRIAPAGALDDPCLKRACRTCP